MSIGRRVTFQQLFDCHPQVCIPIVQRDYAQGRESEEEVRSEFLNALAAALHKPEDDPTLPLDLDFVYGSVDGRLGFLPLDGQQRLTTLMLLHWYLAVKEGTFPSFALKEGTSKRSRFTYAVRPSSMEFFDSLVHWQPSPWGAGEKLSAIIKDQPWFFLSWQMDPTIQSALTMLDAIDLRFRTSAGFYQRLTSTHRPAITFQLLDLQSFGLSDDLYIKMNSRGKPLTAFETFKAQLVHHVGTVLPERRFDLHGREVRVREYVSHKIDTDWADLFWNYRDEATKVFDERFMNVVRAVVLVTRIPGSPGYEELIRALRDSGELFTFFRYYEAHCLDARFLETLILLLDAWCGADGGVRELLPTKGRFAERSFAERAMIDATRLSYADLVQFSAYCSFLTQHGPGNSVAFGEWMRVIVNLSANTNYDRLDDFVRSINSVRDLVSKALEILDFVALPGSDIRGFSGQQVTEERIKAALLLLGQGWREAIQSAEAHGYFAGQVDFLLAFSGVAEDWNQESGFTSTQGPVGDRLGKFLEYRDKAFMVFTGTGVRAFPDFLWERALLAHGDYLLSAGRNASLLHDAASERDVSWKRLLRGGPTWDGISSKRVLVQKVLDRLDPSQDVSESLAGIVAGTHADEEWRALLVAHPEAIAYCRQRNLRRDGSRVFLLKRSRMSGDHVELKTYSLYLRLRPLLGDFDGESGVGYVAVSGDDTLPLLWARFPGKSGYLRVRVIPTISTCTVVLRPDDESAAAFPQDLIDEMTSSGFASREEKLAREASIEIAEQIMLALPDRAKTWAFVS